MSTNDSSSPSDYHSMPTPELDTLIDALEDEWAEKMVKADRLMLDVFRLGTQNPVSDSERETIKAKNREQERLLEEVKETDEQIAILEDEKRKRRNEEYEANEGR